MKFSFNDLTKSLSVKVAFCGICGIIVIIFWVLAKNSGTRSTLQYLTVIGSLLWLIIYTMFGGLDKTMDILNLLILGKGGSKHIKTNPEEKRTLQWYGIQFFENTTFELVPLIIPFILIVYKYRFTNKFLNNIDTEAANLPLGPNNEEPDRMGFRNTAIRDMLQTQLGREDVIIQTIPLVLFGIGLIFENQEFYHNKFLLGGVFFGTGIPMMISGLMIETDTDKLLIMEMMQYIFITFGITMIVQALFKYYLFKRDNKKDKNDMSSSVFIKSLQQNCPEITTNL